MNEKVSPGVLAIVLGVQPLLVALLVEDKLYFQQKSGLILGFIGLSLTVGNIIFNGSITSFGLLSALLSLTGITIGTVLQKQYCNHVALDIKMLIHYAVSAILVLIVGLMFEDQHVTWSSNFIISLIWVSVVMSIGAFFLFFALLRSGKATNVTSLLYCVPPVTAIMDYLVFKQSVSLSSLFGMIFVILSLLMINKRHS